MLAVSILQKEYIWISKNPPEGCSAGPVSDDDISSRKLYINAVTRSFSGVLLLTNGTQQILIMLELASPGNRSDIFIEFLLVHIHLIFQWQAIIVGPLDSPYEHGIFELKVSFPGDYPIKPPQITFITPVYHPNIDKSGRIGLDILRGNWRPVLHLHKVLLSIMSFLADPDPNEPLVPHIAQQYISDRKQYDSTARKWTRMYASS